MNQSFPQGKGVFQIYSAPPSFKVFEDLLVGSFSSLVGPTKLSIFLFLNMLAALFSPYVALIHRLKIHGPLPRKQGATVAVGTN